MTHCNYRLLSLIILHAVFSWCQVVSEEDGVRWVMASVRVRKNYEFREGKTMPSMRDLMKLLNLGNDTSLRQKDSYTTTQGDLVMRLVEFHDNRDVKDSQLDVSVKPDGTIERVGGRVTKGLGKALKKHTRQNCKLFTKEAQKIALAYEGIQQDQIKIERTYISKDLVVSEDGRAFITVAADISWVDPSTESGNFTRKIFTIDACNKTVIDVELDEADIYNNTNHIKPSKELNFLTNVQQSNNNNAEKRTPCDTPASGFGGNLKTGRIQYGIKPYCLDLLVVNNTCFLKNNFVKVVDMHNNITNNPDKVVNFPCQDGYNDTINGGFSVALDTFYHVTQTIRMYHEWYGFQPLKDTRALVHFDRRVANAYWDGRTLMVGDGGQDDTYPFSTLGIVAHEISHGVTEHRSGLHYRGESGGINEAFSDMAGEAVEMFVRGSNDWVVGGEVTKTDGDVIRYFEDPTRDGMSIGHVSQYHKDMDVHKSSGIMNRAFYIASQTLGVRDAFRPFVVANRLYWREKCTFEEAACDVLKASYDTGYPMEIFQGALRTVGLQMSLCPDLNKFILILSTNETRKQVSISKSAHAMYIVKPPSSFHTIEVIISEDITVTMVLATFYRRTKEDVLVEVNGSSLRHTFDDSIDKEKVYLRIAGKNNDLQTISYKVSFF